MQCNLSSSHVHKFKNSRQYIKTFNFLKIHDYFRFDIIHIIREKFHFHLFFFK